MGAGPAGIPEIPASQLRRARLHFQSRLLHPAGSAAELAIHGPPPTASKNGAASGLSLSSVIGLGFILNQTTRTQYPGDDASERAGLQVTPVAVRVQAARKPAAKRSRIVWLSLLCSLFVLGLNPHLADWTPNQRAFPLLAGTRALETARVPCCATLQWGL